MRTIEGFGPLTPDGRASKDRALVIDDDPRTGRTVEEALGASWEVVTVSAASYALELLSAGQRFEVIVCELHARHLTGREFLRRALLIDGALDRRIVFVTTEAEAFEASDFGARPCLRRPLDTDAIRALVQELETRRLLDDIAHEFDKMDDQHAATIAIDDPITGEMTLDAVASTPLAFGPFYAEPLQRSVNHVERMARMLDTSLDEILYSPAFDPGEPTDAERWLIGRADEVELFAGDVLEDWRRGVLSTENATAILDRYLHGVHREMREHVSHSGPLACCEDAEETATRELSIETSTYAGTLSARIGDTPNNVG